MYSGLLKQKANKKNVKSKNRSSIKPIASLYKFSKDMQNVDLINP